MKIERSRKVFNFNEETDEHTFAFIELLTEPKMIRLKGRGDLNFKRCSNPENLFPFFPTVAVAPLSLGTHCARVYVNILTR